MKPRLLAVPVLFVAPFALAHVELVARGVHFKTAKIDFGQPPRRRGFGFDDGTGYAGKDGAWRPGTKYHRDFYDENEESDETRDKRVAARQKALLRQAASAELGGRFAEARRAYAQIETTDDAIRALIGSRTELLATQGLAATQGLSAYLRATHPLTHGPLPSNVGPLLRPWLAYARAKNAGDYAKLARQYPTASRAAAGLIMAARLSVNLEGKRPAPSAMALARSAAERLLHDYPTSRFAWDAQGVMGRVEFLKGRIPQAQARYEIQARTADSVPRTVSAFYSLLDCARVSGKRDAMAYAALRWAEATESSDPYVARGYLYRTLGRFTGADASAFYALLARDPRSFAYYLEFRSSLEATAPDVLSLATNARRVTAGTAFRGNVDATLARVALAAGDGRVRQYALDAQKGGSDDQALGTFVLATIDRRAGRFAEARAGFQRILRDHPKSYLVGGARENLAIVSERLGDFGSALDGYLTLGYEQDAAYLADVRMTPAQLEAYVAKHPKNATLRYTLAMRYLRKGQWDAAETALRPFSEAQRRRLTTAFLKQWSTEDGGLQDPLATVRALRSLDAKIRSAQGDEEKAAALQAMGDYYYRHKCLLLYSGPQWNGGRDYSFAFSWNTAVATPNDDAALRLHYDEHECYTQALTCYRQVLTEFPNSKVAPRAAYWAAVATERLSNMAPYWRWRDQTEDLKKSSVEWMALAAKSPDPALAKKAEKYGSVFAREREEARKAFANEKPPTRRWDPGY